MKAYNSDTKLKEDFVAEIKKHQEQDQIIQGVYGKGSGKEWKGCAVGCSIHSLNLIKKKEHSVEDHSVYEKELGISAELAYLEDAIFEGLDPETSKGWPLRFAQAITPGADLSLITAKFMVWQFEDEKYGLKNIKEVQDDKEIYGFCEEVVALYKRKIAGDTPTEDEFYDLYLKIDRAWAGARARAWAWAWARARAWAWAWARAGARAGAGARARARAWAGARARARARARAWAGAGARAGAEYSIMADQLIKLLEEVES